MLSAPERRRLTRLYQARIGLLAARMTPLVAAAWSNLTDYRDADREAFAEALTPTTTAAKSAAVSLASGYYATVLRARAVLVPVDAVTAAYNAEGPFLAVYKALNDGQPLTDAAAIGGRQAEANAANFVISTGRQAGDQFATRSGLTIERWERVAEADCCDWCSDLDGAEFSTSEAADFGHDRCKCVPEPA